MDERDFLDNLFNSLDLSVGIPKSLLTEEERDIYEQYLVEAEKIEDELEIKYPGGWSVEVDEWLNDEAERRVPGSDRVVRKFISIAKQIAETSGKDS